MSDKKKVTSKNLSKLFLFTENISESNCCNRPKGIPTVCTPVPSGEISIIERESKRQVARKNASETDSMSAGRRQKKNRNVIVVKPCDSPDHTPLPNTRSPSTPLSATSCIDSAFLRYSVPIQIYFMQRRIGSTEIPTDGCLRLPLSYALKKVAQKIDNRYSFYVFVSIYEVHWKRPKNALMKKAAGENIFRTLLKPSTADLNLIDVAKLMELDEINNLNIYIFIKDIDGDKLIDSPDNNAWKFENVLETK